jgi:glycerophosphoryl diester phosphodiesterase
MTRLLAVAVLALACAAPAVAAPLVAAHRGGAGPWPENSLPAFRDAMGLGVDFLETDVHLTADGEVVVLHDPTLDRTTTGTGPVGERRLAELATLRLRAPDGTATDESLPTLARLLDLLAPARAGLLLEIKVGGGGRRYPGIEEKVVGLLRDRGLTARTIVMAFQADTIRRVRQLDPTIRTLLLIGQARMDREGSPAAVVGWATDAGATHLGIEHRALDAAVVTAARPRALGVAAWTVDAEPDMRRMVDLGVDILITNRPAVARRLTGR